MKRKKLLSVFLTAAMLLAGLPATSLSVHATGTGNFAKFLAAIEATAGSATLQLTRD